MAQKLKVGDKVVYPALGAGVIEAIEQKCISGKEQMVYVMRMIHNGLTILVPVGNVTSIGIQNPISLKELETAYEILKDEGHRSEELPETWERRYRRYKVMASSLVNLGMAMSSCTTTRSGENG